MKPLRAYSRVLYQVLLDQLSLSHIHSYDVRPFVKVDDGTVEVLIYFGEDFSHESKRMFSIEQIEGLETEVKVFFKEVGEQCKDVMIADYFKMIKP